MALLPYLPTAIGAGINVFNNYKEAEKACDYAVIRAKAENVEPTSANSLKAAIKKSLAQQQ